MIAAIHLLQFFQMEFANIFNNSDVEYYGVTGGRSHLLPSFITYTS
jgi:hypothetical protein